MGFGIKKEAGSNTTPSDIVNFDKLTPTTAGVVFDPNTPATVDILYVSSVDASTWIWNGTAYITYTAPATATTEWYLYGTTIDAGSNKTAAISRNNSIYALNNDSYFNTVRVGRGKNNIVTNTVVGNAAGQTISTGSGNSFFGTNSGNFNSSGTFNSFFGTYAGYSTTTANSNTFVGYSAGYNNNGDSNVFLGSSSGRYITGGVTTLTASTNSVFLGADTKALGNSQTNQIVIGYNTIGKGSNTVNIGNTSITNTYLNGAVTFNNAFTFPTTDGTANYFLKTNGSGVVTWGVAGLSYFTEAQNTTAPNATVPVDSLTAVTGTTNGDFAIIPKGTGAFLLAIPDSTATGGDKRGANAIDLQTARVSAGRVASGQYSVTLGYNNRASVLGSVAIGHSSEAVGDRSVALGGGAYAGGQFSTAISNNANAIGYGSVAIGSNGLQNPTANGTASVALGGGTAGGNYSFVSGFGSASGNQSVALGGSYGGSGNAVASGANSFALGNSTRASGAYSMAILNNSETFTHNNRLAYGTYTPTASNGIGSIQGSTLVVGVDTTTSTPTTLGAYSGTVIPLILQNNNSIRFRGTIIGRQTGSTNTSAWDIDGFIQRGASAGTTTLLISNVNLVQNTPAWGTPTLTADTTNGGLDIKVIGAATTNIRWTCVFTTTEVIY
jgi:hypothetical protein